MKDFKNKVAVITGAASGIGQGLAERCAKEGMKVVISDIDEKRLRRLERKLNREGAHVLSVLADVSKAIAVEDLAKKTLETFGEVHLLFNNAGIAIPNLAWEYDLKEWEQVLGVNLWGVLHGIHTFIPIMLKQGNECHIVNTSSIEGVISNGVGGATYGVCKHALVHLTERLALELEENGPNIKVSVLCPGFVKTNIFLSALSRVTEKRRKEILNLDARSEERAEEIKTFMEESPIIQPDEVADIVFQAIKKEKLYIFTHKDKFLKERIKERFDAILQSFED
ncbi:MAG: SDR family NAD(P)-dependent oxidoreductase [Candidatus Lokiarchaeota archaeon]|nr:SDR family NAD(P)-dependent oxidoreductase [Candidatus Lokiarchaeota archaeon]